jgi:Pyruvate/2-oxoacid:ferredoxin oxidoreductase gamma subunit
MLGIFAAVTDVVKRESLESAIEASVKPKTIPLNMKAFRAGYEYALEKETGS